MPQDWHFSLALGALLNIAYTAGSFSPTLFTMLVIMAIFSTVITTPALKYYLARGGVERLPPGAAAAGGHTPTGS